MKSRRTLSRWIEGCLLACSFLLWLPGISLPGTAKQRPVARDNAYTVSQTDSNVPMNVLDNDSDADGNDLWITSVQKGYGFSGTVIRESRLLRFTPSGGTQGTGTFYLTYTISDGWDTDSATVAITVQADPVGNDAPPTDPDLPSTGQITGNIENWPVWPQKIAGDRINTFEPSPLTPVGRDITAWVTFDVPSDKQRIWGETLSVLRSNGQGNMALLSDNVRSLAHVDYYTATSTSETRSRYLDDGLADDLEGGAVMPALIDEWFVTNITPDGTVTKSPNQTFPWTSDWDTFLRAVPKSGGRTFTDSGHAWPMVAWRDDSWIALIDKDHAPSGWGTTPRIFLPTNDGLLNVLSAGETACTRDSAVLPGAAFPVAVYQEHLKRIEGQYPRMTMLDGPIMVRDVQGGNGKWHRVLIGSTGLGVDLNNKSRTAWREEGEPVNPDGNPETLADGHHFAVYALDVTDPAYPGQLWNLENTHWERGHSGNPADLEMESSLTRPVIGFTNNGGVRTWHALFVGLDDSGNLKWMDLDPMTGQRHSTGSIGAERTSLSAENVYPSRMLSVYPKNGGEPVLSDVYLYLSNGSLYYWNVQAGEAPKKLASFYIQGSGIGCPPITNFDVAYSDVNHGAENYHTYFSIVVDRDLPGGNPGDSQSLLIVDLENLLGNDFRTASAGNGWEPLSIKMQGAEGKDATTLMGTNPFQIQLDEGNGNGQGSGSNTDLETIAADPVFVDGTLYVAAYRPEYDANGWRHDLAEVSRLYSIPMSRFNSGKKHGNVHSGKTNLIEGTDYTDIEGKKATRFFVDSEGTLFLVDDSGAIVHRADVLDMPSENETGGTIPRDHDMEIVYWREK